jgi:uncharacterized zinc-type alcohol dehydrogenase-like protein
MVPGHEIVGRVSRTGCRGVDLSRGTWWGSGVLWIPAGSVPPAKRAGKLLRERSRCSPTTAKTKTGPHAGGILFSHCGGRKLCSADSRDGLSPERAAPLLCAGITTYSPQTLEGGPGHHLGVVGLGGLGHMAVKFGVSLGAKVTVFSTSPHKREEAGFWAPTLLFLTKEKGPWTGLSNSFRFYPRHGFGAAQRGRPVGSPSSGRNAHSCGGPGRPGAAVALSRSLWAGKTMAGSLIGGIKETQEMLDYCAKAGIQRMWK